MTAAAEDGGGGPAVVRRTEGTQRAEMGRLPFQRVEFGNIEEFAVRHGRQDVAQPLRDHRFPAAGTAFEQKVVHAAGADQCGAFGDLLTADLFEVVGIMFAVVIAGAVKDLNGKRDRFGRGGLHGAGVPLFEKGDGLFERADTDKSNLGDIGQLVQGLPGDDGFFQHSLVGKGEDQRVEQGVLLDAAVEPEFPEGKPLRKIVFVAVQGDQQCDAEVELAAALFVFF